MILEKGQYSIQGLDLSSIVTEHGSPLYIYDADEIERQYKRLSQALQDMPRYKIHYACKSLSNINVLKLIANMGGGIDAVSPFEVKRALEAGFKVKDIVYTPSGDDFGDILKAISLGISVHVDNLDLLKAIADSSPQAHVGIRFRPNLMAGDNLKVSTSHEDSKFGIPIEQASEVLAISRAGNVFIKGLHVHLGSGIYDMNLFMETAELLFDIGRSVDSLDYLDFGGGLKVAYQEGDKTTDIEAYGRIMSERFNAYCKEKGKSLEYKCEPGKYLSSSAGYFVAKVNWLKKTKGQTFACLNTGFNHLMRPMYYNAYHEIINLSNPNGPVQNYDVVGYVCEEDTFAAGRNLPEVRPGDFLCFKNAGAYCMSMASNYNSRPLPAEVLIKAGQAHLIRSRDTYQDVTRNQILL